MEESGLLFSIEQFRKIRGPFLFFPSDHMGVVIEQGSPPPLIIVSSLEFRCAARLPPSRRWNAIPSSFLAKKAGSSLPSVSPHRPVRNRTVSLLNEDIYTLSFPTGGWGGEKTWPPLFFFLSALHREIHPLSSFLRRSRNRSGFFLL